MKSIVLILLLLTAFAFQCHKDQPTAVPACVLQRIDQIKKEPKWNPAAEVHEYDYKGRKAYLFTSNCCDQYIILMDGKCNYICAPSGGISGRGDGKCAAFYEEAKHVKLVWKDNR